MKKAARKSFAPLFIALLEEKRGFFYSFNV